MNKKSVLWLLLDAVFLLVFNTVFYVAGGASHSASAWLSYGFIHFAYIMLLVSPLMIRRGKNSAVFGFSIYSVSATYFLAELLIGIVFVILNQNSVKLALSVQIIVFGIYAAVLIAQLLANESTADSIEQQEAEVLYIKQSALRIKALIGKLDSRAGNKAIERAYDMLYASPTKSMTALINLEQSISIKISELETAVQMCDEENAVTLAGEITALIEERNRTIRNEQ